MLFHGFTVPQPAMSFLRRHRQPLNASLAALMALWQIAQPLQGATVQWTAASSTDFNWGTAANWSGGLLPSLADEVLMPLAIPNPGTLANPQWLTLGAGSLANSLWLQNNYTLSGGSLQLASGVLRADLATYSVLDSLLTGNGGLTKTGGGAVRLGNAANNYTGTTTIANGTLIIGAPGALGADTSAVVVTGSGSRGYSGGSLVLAGSFASGMNFTRDLSLQGHGPIGDRSAAVISVGRNELSGAISAGVGLQSTRITSANGLLTLSGSLDVAGTAGTTVTGLGGSANTTGTAGYALTGVLTGTGTLEKTGSGTLLLQPSDTSGFSGVVRVGSSATGTISSVRISTENVLGTRTATGTGGVLDLNTGTLEVRMDAPSVLAGGAAANVYQRNNATIFADHGLGGSALNGTVAFGQLAYEDNFTLTLNGRNGYGISFTTAPVVGSTAGDNNSTLTNNLGGTAAFTGNFWSNANNTGSRTFTIGGNGNTLINGSIIASAAAFDHVLTKTGTGQLTITGTASTLDGAVNVNGGVLAITDFRSLTNNTAAINIGASTTTANLMVGTSVTPTALGLTTSKVINLAGTTGGAGLYASQPGASPVILNASFTATGGTSANAKTLTLGGTSTAANTINGSIPNNAAGGAVSLAKTGPGTWVLAGANAYTGVTTLYNGTLVLKANAATSTVLPAANDITFGNSNVYAGATLEFVGQPGVNNVQALDVLNSGSGANTIKLTPGLGGSASLSFASQSTGGGGSINFVGADFTTNRITITGANGLISRTNYWEGADFAYRQSNVLRAPVYGPGGDAGFVNADAGLVASSNNRMASSLAANTLTITTLKIDGSHTLTINDGQTLTLSAGGVLATGGVSTITGGTALAMAAS